MHEEEEDEKRTVELFGFITIWVSQKTAVWLFKRRLAKEDPCT